MKTTTKLAAIFIVLAAVPVTSARQAEPVTYRGVLKVGTSRSAIN
jgi:hypothetical protein